MTSDSARPSSRPRPAWLVQFCVVALSAGLVDVALIYFVKILTVAPAAALLAHAAVTALVALWVRATRHAGGDSRLSVLLVLTLSVLGPLGALGSIYCLARWMVHSRTAVPFEEWYSTLFPEIEPHAAAELAEKIRMAEVDIRIDTEVVPFADIISFGAQQEKLEVILRMTKQYQPGFAPALRMALNDKSNVIRVQAATAITKIENDFVIRSSQLELASRRRPDDMQALLELARHHDEYAFTGLLDNQRESDNRSRSLAAYRRYLEQRPGDVQARQAVGRILLREGKYAEAAAWFEEALSMTLSNAEMLLWYMEALAHLGRYAELRELARQHASRWTTEDGFSGEVVEAVQLWAGLPVGSERVRTARLAS